jgi:hypothetical protein
MGERAFHIILELYAQGNLLLTDSNYTVLTLLRTHRLLNALIYCAVSSFMPWEHEIFLVPKIEIKMMP